MFPTHIALAEWPDKPFALIDLPVNVSGPSLELLVKLTKRLQINTVLLVW